jgi:photosystem II stability/assembly factor-like uncharacterized protein
MKRKILFGTALFCLLLIMQQSELHSQSGWYFVNPNPGSDYYLCSKFINPNTGFVSGGFGSILKTTNGGNDWAKIKLPVNSLTTSLTILSNNAILVCCDSGIICRSTNEGNTWTSTNIGIDKCLKGISFSNVNTGIVTCDYGKVFRTTNTGLSWYLVLDSCGFMWCCNCYMLNDTGYVCGSKIYKTTNTGLSWYDISDTSLMGLGLSFINGKTGFVCGSARTCVNLLKTTNGGINWVRLPAIGNYETLTSIYAQDESNIFMCKPSVGLCKSTNGGYNWTTIIDCQKPLYNISGEGQTNLYVVGASSIYKSSNSGNNWQSMVKGYCEDFYNIKVINENTILACGDDGRIIKSTDGGSTWISNKSGNYTELRDMYFINQTTGFAVGDSNKILKTTDGGSSWQITISPSLFPTCISFYDQNTGLIGCSWGKLLKTTNTGNNWIEISDIGITPWKIQMVNQNVIYSASVVSILKSTNGGINWISFNPFPYFNLFYYSLHFFNENTGYVTSDSGFISKTTNGGINWETTKPGDNSSLMAIKFIDYQTGYVTGKNGNVYKTTDGGNNWFKQFQATTQNLLGIDFFNSNTGFICGANGTILKTTTGGTIGITQITIAVPPDFKLEQNYPNPFNPSTNIRYALKENVFVTLKIYDVLGRTVNILVNQNQKAGEYEVSFNGENLSSGVYFYSLITGNFRETKRMLLLK